MKALRFRAPAFLKFGGDETAEDETALEAETPVKAETGLAEGETTETTATTETTEATTEEAPAKVAGTAVKIVARTANAATSWWFGPCVHSFEGMRASARMPLDYCHDPKEVIGFAETPKVEGDALVIPSYIQPFKDGDRASEILFRGKAGTPYQASIQMSENYKSLWLSEGQSAVVDGRTVEGPCTIFTEWELIGLAVCPQGVDIGTSVGFDGEAPATTETEDVPALSEDTETEAGTATELSEPETTETELSDTTETIPEGEDKKLSQNPTRAREGQRFITAFGADRGAGYFAKGLSFSQAQQAFQKDLVAENAQLKTQLSAKPGKQPPASSPPVKFTPTTDEKPLKSSQFTALPTGLSVFAGGIKIPNRSKK